MKTLHRGSPELVVQNRFSGQANYTKNMNRQVDLPYRHTDRSTIQVLHAVVSFLDLFVVALRYSPSAANSIAAS